MEKIKEKVRRTIKGKTTVCLFTGDNGSTLLMNTIEDLTAVEAGMDIKVVFIDTGYHFEEIIDYVKTLNSKIEIVKNDNTAVDHLADMNKCCACRKKDVLEELLRNIKAEYLVVPFRDEENYNGIEDSYLKGIDNVEILRPFAGLTERDIWSRIKEYKLPYSTVYNKGYRTVDCKCCTTRQGRKTQEDEDRKEITKEMEEKLRTLGYM